MINLQNELAGANSVAIAGHVRPDGDCVGSCMGLALYLRKYFPELQRTEVYLESIPESFHFLKDSDTIRDSSEASGAYDVVFVLDCGDRERLGDSAVLLDNAKKVVCIDHHISNKGFGEVQYIEPQASSTSELIYLILDEEKIDTPIAEALYMGIAHDTGVFQYSNCTRRTMEIAGLLMEKGIDFSGIVDRTFFQKTYIQNQILGRALLESMMLLDGQCIISAIRKKDMEFYGAGPKDLEGIVSQMRYTTGVEVAMFLYETSIQEYKVSLRSNNIVDVSKIASYFGGGGHVRAAGCTMQGNIHDVINNLTRHIEKQLEEAEEKQTLKG